VVRLTVEYGQDSAAIMESNVGSDAVYVSLLSER